MGASGLSEGAAAGSPEALRWIRRSYGNVEEFVTDPGFCQALSGSTSISSRKDTARRSKSDRTSRRVFVGGWFGDGCRSSSDRTAQMFVLRSSATVSRDLHSSRIRACLESCSCKLDRLLTCDPSTPADEHVGEQSDQGDACGDCSCKYRRIHFYLRSCCIVGMTCGWDQRWLGFTDPSRRSSLDHSRVTSQARLVNPLIA